MGNPRSDTAEPELTYINTGNGTIIGIKEGDLIKLIDSEKMPPEFRTSQGVIIAQTEQNLGKPPYKFAGAYFSKDTGATSCILSGQGKTRKVASTRIEKYQQPEPTTTG